MAVIRGEKAGRKNLAEEMYDVVIEDRSRKA